jgi:Spy/CpxP family protein refolding chaperone
MTSGKCFLCAALLFANGSLLSAADQPTTMPAAEPADIKPPHAKKLVEPWSLIKTLTPEQVTQIETLHSDAEEQVKKIHKKESDDITALLTPDQVTEMKEALAKHKLELKEKALAKKHPMAATEPAN